MLRNDFHTHLATLVESAINSAGDEHERESIAGDVVATCLRTGVVEFFRESDGVPPSDSCADTMTMQILMWLFNAPSMSPE